MDQINNELPNCSDVTGDFNARCSKWWNEDITNLFCNNMNLISNFGVDFSIFEKCHHNIIFGKINIRIPLPPSYIREVWDYSKANTKNIKKAVKSFDWNKSFSSLSVDGKVEII